MRFLKATTLLYLLLLFFIGCNTSKKESHKYTNSLINETSPYLLQHAHNPVNWYSWSDETLEKAKKENKLILISIGYASCHWCHVMEEESFENEEVAKIMNENFINIKVDREERPDVDKTYINAVQLMTGNAGWPLNCITLPNGTPIWGGTYFEKDEWIKSISEIAKFYKEDQRKMEEYGRQISKSLKPPTPLLHNTENAEFTENYISTQINTWSNFLDKTNGGLKGETKFPLPSNQQFLLRVAYQLNNSEIKTHIDNTLTKMALGGLFDHVEGGFSRYSVDNQWKIPHFEKMLYDNGQMISLYANAYQASGNSLYKDIVYNTISFTNKNLLSKEGGFYSSLNADSKNHLGEAEEGAYYVFSEKELNSTFKDDYLLFSKYYSIKKENSWEGNYHLKKEYSDEIFAKENSIDIKSLKSKIKSWEKKLIAIRSKKSKPEVDTKILTSWNALMLKGYVDAYRVFNEDDFLNTAINNANFIKDNLLNDFQLNRSYKDGTSTINAYLEDYATLINAYIALYQVTFDNQWLEIAKSLTDETIKLFFDESSNFFFYKRKDSQNSITQNIETEDSVIPSSNALMAENLFLLGHYYGNKAYSEKSKTMITSMVTNIEKAPFNHAKWLSVYLDFNGPFYEVAISGKESLTKRREIEKWYIPNKLVCGDTKDSNAYLLTNRFVEGETLIYVCQNNTCKLPTNNTKKAISLMK